MARDRLLVVAVVLIGVGITGLFITTRMAGPNIFGNGLIPQVGMLPMMMGGGMMDQARMKGMMQEMMADGFRRVSNRRPFRIQIVQELNF